MPRYAAPFTKTNSDSVLQILEILSQATVQRCRLDHLIVKNKGTEAADAVFDYVVRRVTGSATGTALTPNPVDPNDAACRSAAKHIITADAASFSGGAELLRVPLNNRATFQWMASDGQELVGAAVNTNGLSVGVAAATTSTFAGTAFFKE